jgi:hypothetical protein
MINMNTSQKFNKFLVYLFAICVIVLSGLGIIYGNIFTITGWIILSFGFYIAIHKDDINEEK